MTTLPKPINRSPFRQNMGKRYYILKRTIKQKFSDNKWSEQIDDKRAINPVFKHQSFIMRPLRNVDMYLQENKKTNLKLAIQKLNGTFIAPRHTFSFWKQVGRPSKSKGYLEGLVLNQGKIDTGVGGGLCQLGNLLFWIFAHSPLSLKERHRHGFDVFPDVNRKVPFGAGATLSYNYIDLQVKNNTKHGFQLFLWMDDDYLYGELFCTSKLKSKFKVIEVNHQIKHQLWGGYSRHNQIIKIEKDSFGKETSELLVENHALMMYSPYLPEKNKSNL